MLSSDIANSPSHAATRPEPFAATAQAVSSQRLIVDHIVLENFKSYAGRQVIGPFHANFTSIVGPNGSGKSNVIDAFMFVLGYRAKKLRQSKLSELIHNSEGMMDLDSCTVEVHFSIISLSGQVLEGLVVSRTAYRNNSNRYFVNGQPSNYTDVTTLLKDYGVDLDHKRFLILQGEVESIAQMKPKAATEHEEGLLEYLEDIIGTNKYIEPIEAAGKAVDAANDLCAEKNVRVKASEKDVISLQSEKNAAEDFIRQENQLAMKKAELFQLLRYQAELQIGKFSDRIASLREKLAKESEMNEAAVKEADDLERSLKEFVNKHTDLEKEAAATARKLTACEKEDIKLQETRKHLKNKIKNVTKALTDGSKSKSAALHELQNIEHEMQILAADIKELDRSLQQENTALDAITISLKGKTGELQTQLEALQKQMMPWNEKIRMEQDALESAVLALSSFQKKQKALETELSTVEERLRASSAELDSATLNSKSMQLQKAEQTKEVTRLEDEIKAGEKIQATLAGTIATVQQTLAEANEAVQQTRTGNATLNGLMKESSAGRIKGIYGRLGDLGVIDARYDVAISTACSFLNYIVVDTAKTGSQCVDFLRTNNLGRASFIILEKMKAADLRPDLPAKALRLFDLVKVREDRFRSAFYYALNDTLVAEDMDEASKLAYGHKRRYRVVTLDGKLIDTSGTMSGGGTFKQHGGMKANFASSSATEITPEQLRELGNLLNSKLAEQQQVRAGLMQFQELLSKAKLELKRLDVELRKTDILSSSLPTQISELAEQLEQLKTRDSKPTKEDQEKMVRLKGQVAQYESNIAELKGSAAPLQLQIDTCQAQILEAGGIQFKAQRTKVNDLRDQLKLQERRLNKLAGQKTALEKKLEAKDDATEQESEMAAIEAQIADVETQIEKITIDAFNLTQERDKLANAIATLKESIEEVKKQHDVLSKQLARFRKAEFELKNDIEKLEGELDECQRQVKACEGSLSQLRISDVRIDNEPVPEIPIFEAADLKDMLRGLETLKATIRALEERLGQLQLNVNVIEEYRQREAAFNAIREEYLKLEAERDASRSDYESLRRKRHDEFMAGFRQISLRLKELYQLITMGGNAELELVDSLDPFSEGILFSVMPPKKSWKNISNLSGGEKTLSSLALVFALHSFKSTPIYVMDEIDAALDFRNVSIVANYIKERTKDAQFIVISLRNNMFELADRLVGIYKTSQRTKSVAIDPNSFAVGAFIQQHPLTQTT